MQRVIDIALTGHDRRFRLHEDGYDALRAYLDQAGTRLAADPDKAEVLGDLERSIGERLASRAPTDDRVLSTGDVAAVLEAVGNVEVGASGGGARTGADGVGEPPRLGRPRHRRLYRVREGQDIAGVCTGIAVYADVSLDWVRTVFILLALVTAGAWILVYLALVFLLPIVDTKAEWLALMHKEAAAQAA